MKFYAHRCFHACGVQRAREVYQMRDSQQCKTARRPISLCDNVSPRPHSLHYTRIISRYYILTVLAIN